MSCGDCGGALLITFMLWVTWNFGYTAGINDALDELDDLGLAKDDAP